MNKSKKYVLVFLTILFAQNSCGSDYINLIGHNWLDIMRYKQSLYANLLGSAGLGLYLLQEKRSPWLAYGSIGTVLASVLMAKYLKQEEAEEALKEKYKFTLGDQELQELTLKNIEVLYQKKFKTTMEGKTITGPWYTHLDPHNKAHLKILGDPFNYYQGKDFPIFLPESVKPQSILNLQYRLDKTENHYLKTKILDELKAFRTIWLERIQSLKDKNLITYLEELYFFCVINWSITRGRLQTYNNEKLKIDNILVKLYANPHLKIDAETLESIWNNIKKVYEGTYDKDLIKD